jgi:hypothetical protein
MRLPKKPYYRFQAILAIATLAHASVGSSLLWAADDSFAPVRPREKPAMRRSYSR